MRWPDRAVLERRERLGGTWDLFGYPGIRPDSDMLTFGYKFRPLKVLAVGPSIPLHRRHRRRVPRRRQVRRLAANGCRVGARLHVLAPYLLHRLSPRLTQPLSHSITKFISRG